MHPVKLDDGEMALVREALHSGDWKSLPTWKLRYVYQKFTKSTKDIKDIGIEARKIGNEKQEELAGEADKIFGID